MGGFLAAFGWHVMDFFISEAAQQGIEPEEPPLNTERKLASRGRRMRSRSVRRAARRADLSRTGRLHDGRPPGARSGP